MLCHFHFDIYILNFMLNPESTRQPFWAISVKEVFSILETREDGITDSQVQERRHLFGINAIDGQSGTNTFDIAKNQLKSPMIIILLVAGGVTLFLREWVNASVILAAVLINSALGFYQENKAETALELLKSYVRTRCRIKRGGRDGEVDAVDLVPGDIIRVSQGDRIPADCRVFFANNLEVDESVLTGESLPITKNSQELQAGTELGERTSMVYNGTLVVGGFGDAVVTTTGNHTEFGRIASLIEKRERQQTPLQKSISDFATKAGLILGCLVAFLFSIGVIAGEPPFEMFLIGVAVAVSAVPEGLPIALTVILAAGVERLAKSRGIVRRLLAAETLGSTSIILTDKTGTLTQAKMQMVAAIPRDISPHAQEELLSLALLNTDIVIENPEAPFHDWKIFGKALEVALTKGAAEKGITMKEAQTGKKVIDRIPFNSKDKYSVSLSEVPVGGHLVVLIGAPEILLQFSALPENEREATTQEIERRAHSGERLIAVASKTIKSEPHPLEKHFGSLDFKGLIAFRDPLRPSVAGAIAKIAAAGVKTIIVTGDHKGTADAVARELGMIDGHGAILTGNDLNFLSEDELMSRADEVTVFARVTPEQKMKLVNLFMKKGEVVAVTGDGVNDAPALQAADIGIAVGSGTDVAKGAADLIILDDNFETIVAAIEEGRKILDNIRKVIVYLLSDALDELLLIGGSLLLGLAIPLNALQILFVNFFSDSFPAIAFAFEHGVDNLGNRPKKLSRNFFDKTLRMLIFVIGISTSALLFIIYYALLAFEFDPNLVRSFIFATFATYSLILSFSLRSLEKSIFSYNPFSNSYLTWGVGIGVTLTLLALYLRPLGEILGTVPLPPLWLSAVLGVGLLNILAVELGKLALRPKKVHHIQELLPNTFS